MSTTSRNVAEAVTKIVAVDALPALMGQMVMGNLVTRNFKPYVCEPGDIVNIPLANADPPTELLGTSAIPLNTHAEATFQIPDITKVLAIPELLKLYMSLSKLCQLA